MYIRIIKAKRNRKGYELPVSALELQQESCEEKTVVLVSHRKSTMNLADVVYEMDHGRLS